MEVQQRQLFRTPIYTTQQFYEPPPGTSLLHELQLQHQHQQMMQQQMSVLPPIKLTRHEQPTFYDQTQTPTLTPIKTTKSSPPKSKSKATTSKSKTTKIPSPTDLVSNNQLAQPPKPNSQKPPKTPKPKNTPSRKRSSTSSSNGESSSSTTTKKSPSKKAPAPKKQKEAQQQMPILTEQAPNEDEDVFEDDDNKDSDSKKKPRRRKRMLTGVSKQRRAANERERKRLQIINDAFKDLKSILPLFPTEENISKIEIVRLASRTIKYLSELIHENDTDTNDIDTCNEFLESLKYETSSSGCCHSTCGSICGDENLPDPAELSPVDFDTSNMTKTDEIYDLLFTPDEKEKTTAPQRSGDGFDQFDQFDSGTDLPSPSNSDSSKDSFAGLDFGSFMAPGLDSQIPGYGDVGYPDVDEFTSPSMLFW